MIRWLVIILAIGYLMPTSVLAEQPRKDASDEVAQADDASLIESLTDLKNPFVSLMPKASVAQPTPQPSPVPVPETPMAAPAAEETIPSDLKINGIVWGGDRPQAIINGQVVSIGDTIQEAKVIAITKQGVAVRYKSKKITLTVDQ